MYKIIIALCLSISCVNAHAGCVQTCDASVNGEDIFWNGDWMEPNVVSGGWKGRCYVDNIFGDFSSCSARVFFQPGDTVYLSGIGMVTMPGSYSGQHNVCEDVLYCTNSYVCLYLTDTLETYYRSMFDPKYIDSMKDVKTAYADSLSALPLSFYPNPVFNVATLESFYNITEPVDIEVLDLQGRPMLTQRFDLSGIDQVRTLDMTGLQSGPYMVKYTLNRRRFTKQIVKL